MMNVLRGIFNAVVQAMRGDVPAPESGAAPPAASFVEVLLSRLMLGAGMLFVFYVLQPTLDHGMLAAGDDTIHSAYTLETIRIFKEHGRLFDWTNIFGLGEPIYIFRPPGFYFVVLALDLLGFGHLPVMFVHKLAYVLALSLYPGAVYYLFLKFRFPVLARGIAALLTFGCISTFGHTLDAYYNLGLAKQTFAILCFPFALGKLHGIVAYRERVLPGAMLFGFMFLSHPYMGLSFCMIGGAYMLTAFLAQASWRWWLQVLARTGLMIVSGLALVAFWLVPFYTSDEIQLTAGYSTSRREGFAIVNDTAAGTLRHLMRGSLFDRSPTANPPDVFGGKSDWAWRPNPGNGRWPVLSWFSMAGACVLIARGRRWRHAFFVNAWVLCLMIFMGPDDMTWLLRVPFQEQFQYLHFIPFPELFTVCLAALGLYALGLGATRMVAKAWGRFRGGELPPLAGPIVLLACVLPFVINVWHERLAYSANKLHNRVFEIGPTEQTTWSLQQQQNMGFKQCTDYLRAQLDPFERFYGSPTKVHAGEEIFHFSVAPAYMGRTDLISPLFGGLIGGVNHIVHTGEFRFELWKSPMMLDLLRVGAVVMNAPNEVNFPFNPAVYQDLVRFPRWTVYKAPKSGPCGVTTAKPILFVGDAVAWESTCVSWLAKVQVLTNLTDFHALPFFVWERQPRRDRADAVPLANFKAVWIADGMIDPARFFQTGELQAFREAGGGIMVRPTRFHLGTPAWATATAKVASDMRLEDFSTSVGGADVAVTTVEERDGFHAVEVEAGQACFMYLKMAYYRGWRVAVDGRAVANQSTSPGFNGCFVPAGRHRVEFQYTGANHATAGWTVSGIAFVGLLVPALWRRKRLS